MTWTHRIDAIPAVGRRIEFRRDDTPSRFARVVPTRDGDRFYDGLGDDVRLDPEDSTGVLLIPSKTYSWWRYV